MGTKSRPPLGEVLALAIGLIASAASGVWAYQQVGSYGDGPFAYGYHRERDLATGRSTLVQEYRTAKGRGRRVIDERYRVTEIGFSLSGDDIIDAWAYRDTNGQVVRIEVSTKRDGRVDRWEQYSDGQLVRVDIDTNGNGRRDRWQIYENGAVTRAEIDVDEDGRADPEKAP